MPLFRFPDPRISTPEGIIALGGNLDPANLIVAYQNGIFPWPIEGLPLAWFCPPERAILEYKHLHLSRSLIRARNKNRFRFTVNQEFEKVILNCSRTPRPDQAGTWITPEVKNAYCKLHELGHAHSVEVWNKENLVGGLYGVSSSGAFAAESMYYHEPYASKLAILFLMDHFFSRGLEWIDIQVMTPHMETLGARLISRDEFLRKLADTQSQQFQLFTG